MTVSEKALLKIIENLGYGENTPLPNFMAPAAAFTTLTTGDAAIGSWTEIEDSALQDCLITHVIAVPNTVDEIGTVHIGIGASDSEVTKIEFPTQVATTLDSIIFKLKFPIRVRYGDRVAGRFFTDTNSGTCLVKLLCMYDMVGGEAPASGGAIIKHLNGILRDSEQTIVYDVLPAAAATTFLITPGAVTAGASWADGTADALVTTTANCLITHVVLTNAATPTTYMELDILVAGTVVASVPVKLVDANQLQIIELMTPIPVMTGLAITTVARGSAATAVSVALITINAGYEP